MILQLQAWRQQTLSNHKIDHKAPVFLFQLCSKSAFSHTFIRQVQQEDAFVFILTIKKNLKFYILYLWMPIW